jgi:hypothetical protein
MKKNSGKKSRATVPLTNICVDNVACCLVQLAIRKDIWLLDFRFKTDIYKNYRTPGSSWWIKNVIRVSTHSLWTVQQCPIEFFSQTEILWHTIRWKNVHYLRGHCVLVQERAGRPTMEDSLLLEEIPLRESSMKRTSPLWCAGDRKVTKNKVSSGFTLKSKQISQACVAACVKKILIISWSLCTQAVGSQSDKPVAKKYNCY